MNVPWPRLALLPDPRAAGDLPPWVRGVRGRWLARPAGLACDGDAREWLEFLCALEPRAVLKQREHRQTIVVAAGKRELVLKRMRRQDGREGFFELLRHGRTRSDARRECENLLELQAGGFPVPRVLGWFEERRAAWGPFAGSARSVLVMERVPFHATLCTLAEEASPASLAPFASELAELVARLHASGWYHRDLYLQHVVVGSLPRAGSRLCLLDLGRARHAEEPALRWFVKDLAALLASTPTRVSGRTTLRFFARYARLRGIQPRLRRRLLLRAVLRKAARLSAHVPRDQRGAAR